MSQPFFIHQNLNDFDEFCCNMQNWDLDYRQMETGYFSSELLMFGNDTTIFSRVKLGRKLRQQGASPHGLISLGLLVNPKTRIHWRNYEISGDMLFIFPPDRELDSITHDDFDVYPLSISEEALNHTCKSYKLPDIKTLISDNEVFHCNPDKLSELRIWLLSVYHQLIIGTAAITNAQYMKQIEQGLADRLVRILAEHQQPAVKINLRKRDIALRTAENYIAESGIDVITIPELCSAVGVSERTLEYAFQERYNMTPKKYTLIHRLNNVRKQLRRAEPIVGYISEIAHQHGFWHMGQFSADYKKLFCELPSETLKVS